MEKVEKEVLNRSEYLFDKIQSIPDLELITSTEPGRYAGIVTFRHSKANNAGLHQHLTANNVVCAFRAGGIRFSPHFYTPYEHLDRAFDLAVHSNGDKPYPSQGFD
jgi:selenocysteine lyase/cysteine desulfurase